MKRSMVFGPSANSHSTGRTASHKNKTHNQQALIARRQISVYPLKYICVKFSHAQNKHRRLATWGDPVPSRDWACCDTSPWSRDGSGSSDAHTSACGGSARRRSPPASWWARPSPEPGTWLSPRLPGSEPSPFRDSFARRCCSSRAVFCTRRCLCPKLFQHGDDCSNSNVRGYGGGEICAWGLLSEEELLGVGNYPLLRLSHKWHLLGKALPLEKALQTVVRVLFVGTVSDSRVLQAVPL